MVPMSQSVEDPSQPESKFFKTPCGHHFHKKCLLDWMKEKHQCPVCRTTLPYYENLNDDY